MLTTTTVWSDPAWLPEPGVARLERGGHAIWDLKLGEHL